MSNEVEYYCKYCQLPSLVPYEFRSVHNHTKYGGIQCVECKCYTWNEVEIPDHKTFKDVSGMIINVGIGEGLIEIKRI